MYSDGCPVLYRSHRNLLGDLDIDEFLRKLHEHLGAARRLFDFNEDVADEISDEVSKIVTKVSGSLVESSALSRL